MSTRRTRTAVVGLLIACFATFDATVAHAQPPPPQLTAPVNDFANVIDAESERELDKRIRSLKAASGDVVVVATVRTYKPYADIDEYAVKMFENGGRGIGEKGKDNGLLIVVAVDDRRVRIEVGYDLEQFITDGFAGETIRDLITPQFKNGDYGGGLLAGVTTIVSRIAERRGVTLQDVPPPPAPRRTSSGFPWWIIVIWILIVVVSRRGRGRRRMWGGGPWSGWNSGIGPFGGGGGFGGGFGGFGGGGGGGGGGAAGLEVLAAAAAAAAARRAVGSPKPATRGSRFAVRKGPEGARRQHLGWPQVR